VFRNEHLLIDGYNIIHAWPQLRKSLQTGQDVARERLIDTVRPIHDFEGVRTTIVFDGQGNDIQIERPGNKVTLSCLFSPTGVTADEIIERLVENSKNPQHVTVATDDNIIAQIIFTFGAFCISSNTLQERVLRCEKQQKETIEKFKKKARIQWKE
jgi:predicted RNA-binding protein with PIN domain